MIEGGLVEYPDPDRTQDIHSPVTECHVNVTPATPDQVLVIADTAGKWGGAVWDGAKRYQLQHNGLKLNMRHLDKTRGYDPIKAVFDFVRNMPPNQVIRSRGMSCFVQSAYNASSVISLGEEPGTKRYLWSLNVMLVMGDVEQTPVES